MRLTQAGHQELHGLNRRSAVTAVGLRAHTRNHRCRTTDELVALPFDWFKTRGVLRNAWEIT